MSMLAEEAFPMWFICRAAEIVSSSIWHVANLLTEILIPVSLLFAKNKNPCFLSTRSYEVTCWFIWEHLRFRNFSLFEWKDLFTPLLWWRRLLELCWRSWRENKIWTETWIGTCLTWSLVQYLYFKRPLCSPCYLVCNVWTPFLDFFNVRKLISEALVNHALFLEWKLLFQIKTFRAWSLSRR